MKARPALPALAVLPILSKDREARTKTHDGATLDDTEDYFFRKLCSAYEFDGQLTCECTS